MCPMRTRWPVRSSPPEKRGTALSIITGGTSIAVALGVPISALIGHGFGWRLTFVVVGALSILATAGLLFGLDRDAGAGLPVASLRERIAVVRQKPVLLALLVTLLWAGPPTANKGVRSVRKPRVFVPSTDLPTIGRVGPAKRTPAPAGDARRHHQCHTRSTSTA